MFDLILLFIIAILIIAVVGWLTYFLFFRKYYVKVNKLDKTDVKYSKSRLKYCLNCGESLNKKGKCTSCGSKY